MPEQPAPRRLLLSERALRYVLGFAPSSGLVQRLESVAPARAPALETVLGFGAVGRATLRVSEPVLRRRSHLSGAWLDAAASVAENSPEGAAGFYKLPDSGARVPLLGLLLRLCIEAPAVLLSMLLPAKKRSR